MSGDDHGTTGELDLDAIERRASYHNNTYARLGQRQDIPALVAEVRRLRDALADVPSRCPHRASAMWNEAQCTRPVHQGDRHVYDADEANAVSP